MEQWESIEFAEEKRDEKLRKQRWRRKTESKIVANLQSIYCPFDQVIDLFSTFLSDKNKIGEVILKFLVSVGGTWNNFFSLK